MMQLVAIAAGGALGAVFRFWLSTATYTLLGRGFPYGTLLVNILGSFLMGMATVLLIERLAVSAEWRAAILIGLLGAFTTFSTFSMETYNLVIDGAVFKAALNVLASVILCLLAVWMGIVLGRQI